MNHKKFVLILAITVLTGVLLFYHQREQADSSLNSESSFVEATKTTNTNQNKTISLHNFGANSDQNKFPDSEHTNFSTYEESLGDIDKRYHQGLISKDSAMLESLSARNLRSQDFYGKVIDQDGSVLVGAKVDAELVFNTGAYGSVRVQKYSTVTDQNGLFGFTGIHGAGLGVRVSKDGYDQEGNNQSCKGPVGEKTTPNDRAIYTMWSTNMHEQLITGNKSFEIMPDGSPHFINLTDGTVSEHEGGDLKVWIQYTNQAVRGQLYDWSAGIEVINGELSEVVQTAINSGFSDESPFAMYSAPKDGYTNSFHLQQQIKGGQSGEIGNRFFYLLLNNGNKYGKISINLFAPYGRLHPGLIRVSYAINPSGSRILR